MSLVEAPTRQRLACLVVIAALNGSCARVGFRPSATERDGPSMLDCGSCQSDAGAPIGPTWNTFLGGAGTEYGMSIVVDGSGGSVLVCGMSNAAWGNPAEPFHEGNWDAFVAKLNPGGDLVWNTFLGSEDWGGDRCLSVAVDGSGCIYVAGFGNRAWGTPLRPFSGSSGDDAFVAKLGLDGRLLWNTFLGGMGSDTGMAIALDGSGHIYVAGTSGAAWSAPTTARPYSGRNDVFIAKLRPDGALLWNTFLGSPAGQDEYGGGGLVVDGSGNAYAVGFSSGTWGTPQRPFSGDQDAFAVKVGPDGSLLWNTFLGGGGVDEGRRVALDGGGNVVLTGYSAVSWGTPVMPFAGGVSDAFVAKLDGAGRLVWHTFLGGTEQDIGDAIVVDGAGSLYVAGFSRAAWGVPRRPYQGGLSDGFVAKLDGAGHLRWHTFLGSSGGTGPDDDYAEAIALDSRGAIYVAGDSDATWGAPRRAFTTGSHDAFAAKIEDAP